MTDLPDYDRWLARYRHHRTTAYCQDPDCPNAEGLPVEYHEEYGQGWIEPEECPDCGEALGNEPPQEPDEDEQVQIRCVSDRGCGETNVGTWDTERCPTCGGGIELFALTDSPKEG